MWLSQARRLAVTRGSESDSLSVTYLHQRSVLSFAFPSATVCHWIFDGASAPPHSSGFG